MATDEQVELLRALARKYPGLTDLTAMPYSMRVNAPTSAVEDIRILALSYVVNAFLERTERDKNDQKQILPFPGHMCNPYIDIPDLPWDPEESIKYAYLGE